MNLSYRKMIISLCITIFLVNLIVVFSVNRSAERRTAGASVNTETYHSCRSLFTITEVPHLNILAAARLLQYSARNFTNEGSLPNHTWASPHYNSTQNHFNMSEALRRVEHLLHKRTSSSGASTEDYRRLAELLPTLLFFQDNNNPKQETPTASVRFFSRIGAMGGVLPYIPCRIAPFDDPTIVTTCFKERLTRDSLWIAFIGDSKVRGLFYEFLQRTDSEYHYIISFMNTTEPFAEMRKRYIRLHTDMEATTPVHPGLRITFSFRIFVEMVPSKVNTSREIQELGKWARGEETPPQLLLLGYTSWMMQRMLQFYSHDVYSLIMEMHQKVAALLQQISVKTRVLVTSQTRYKPHGVSGRLQNFRIAFGDASTEWSEMFLLYYLQKNREHQQASSRDSLVHPTLVTLPQEDQVGDSATPSNLRPQAQPSRDYLLPSQTGGGVWWWDTILPLNIADISECEELYDRGMMSAPIYGDGKLNCLDPHHSGTVTLADMVTMLLNLMCTSLIQTDTNLCCS